MPKCEPYHTPSQHQLCPPPFCILPTPLGQSNAQDLLCPGRMPVGCPSPRSPALPSPASAVLSKSPCAHRGHPIPQPLTRCPPCPHPPGASHPCSEHRGKPAMKSGQKTPREPAYKRIYFIRAPGPRFLPAPKPLGLRHAGNAPARALVTGFRSLSPNMVPGPESWCAVGLGEGWGLSRGPLTSLSGLLAQRRPPNCAVCWHPPSIAARLPESLLVSPAGVLEGGCAVAAGPWDWDAAAGMRMLLPTLGSCSPHWGLAPHIGVLLPGLGCCSPGWG